MIKRLKCLFGHRYKFGVNVYGDMINLCDGARTHLICERCGKGQFVHDFLVPVNKAPQHTSDGYHTFDELYYHRMMLFSVICETYKEHAWKSKLHHDGTMYDNYFVVGVNTPQGQYTYHYHMNEWNEFNVKELDRAPVWDGHEPKHVYRLKGLVKR